MFTLDVVLVTLLLLRVGLLGLLAFGHRPFASLSIVPCVLFLPAILTLLACILPACAILLLAVFLGLFTAALLLLGVFATSRALLGLVACAC